MTPATHTDYRRLRTAQRVYLEERPAYAALLERWSAGERSTQALAPLLVAAHDREGVSQAAIARGLGLSPQSVSQRIALARRQMKDTR